MLGTPPGVFVRAESKGLAHAFSVRAESKGVRGKECECEKIVAVKGKRVRKLLREKEIGWRRCAKECGSG